MITVLVTAFAMLGDRAATACAASPGSGWTLQGDGAPAQMVVLGSESCQGSVLGVGLNIVAPPQHGKIRVIGPSAYLYTPNRAYRGPDEIRVSVTIAGVGLVIGTIAITIL